MCSCGTWCTVVSETNSKYIKSLQKAWMNPNSIEYLRNHFPVTLFIKETGHCLKLPDVTIATGCVLYHRFISATDNHNDFDLNIVASTALYVAGKAEETPCKLRDIINVSYSILNKDKPPIEIAKKYWALRDSLVQCELLFLRLLGFQVTVDNPHKYMLQYLKSLEDWCNDHTWQVSQLPQISWSILNDTFHTTLCLEETAPQIAVAVVYFAVSSAGLKIPSETAKKQWWQVFCPDITQDNLQQIVHKIMDLYDFDTDKISPVP